VLSRFFATGSTAVFDAYTPLCERRVWRVQHFSWWMTSMMHRFAEHDAFQRQVQLAELAYVTSSRAAATALAENYVGLPIAALEDA
jgi:p-hydroxybenzoate 3-monooxygenase